MKVPEAIAALLHSAAIVCSSRLVPLARDTVHQTAPHSKAPVAGTPRQLLVDVSIIAANDGGTGIQRVVRSILAELIRIPLAGFVIRPIQATRKTPFRYASEYAQSLGAEPDSMPDGPIVVARGDVFLGLDLGSRIAPSRRHEFLAWRKAGVGFAFVVYDLLPANRPSWFTQRARRDFNRWLRLIAIHSDALFCISKAVADEVETWMERRYKLHTRPSVGWFHLGADAPCPKQPITCPSETLAQHLRNKKQVVLMVGTIEPRKGYAQILDVFEHLWRTGQDVALVIVGRSGWRTEDLVARLRNHPEQERRLIWLADAHDGHVAWLYRHATGLLMASESEGFGLPLIEAARHGLPILARDLPVFQEVAGAHASYFNEDEHVETAARLMTWLTEITDGAAPDSRHIAVMDWKTATERFTRLLASV